MNKNERLLYRFKCSAKLYSNVDMDNLKNLDFCSSCEDRIFYFVSSPENWYQDLCKIIVRKFQKPGKYECIWGDRLHNRLPRSFLRLQSYRTYPGEEDYKLMLKEMLESSELFEILKTCIRDMGVLSQEEFEGLRKRKIYTHIKTPRDNPYAVL